jgi:CBS domain-containing protein
MVRETYTCEACDLATFPVESVAVTDTVDEVRTWLSESGFDVAPVADDGAPAGYVTIEKLGEAPSGDSIREHSTPVTLSEIIASDASFLAVLEGLYDELFFFLGGRNEVTGILTRADLNTAPAYIHFYERLTLLEERLRDLLVETASNWKSILSERVSPDEIEAIERRHSTALSANIDLEEVHYAQFSALTKVIPQVEAAWKTCGFSSDRTASRELDAVTDVRNAVAHSNLLVENTEGGLGEGRTVGELIDVHQTISACNESLSDSE